MIRSYIVMLAASAVGSASAQPSYSGGVYHQTFDSPPGATNSTGNYNLSVIAADNDGGSATSGAVPIAVANVGTRSFVSAVAENFDSMGTGTSFLLGWSIKNGNAGTYSTWTNAIPISGTGTGGLASMIATTGVLTFNNAPSATNVNGYNAQGATVADRVLATSPTIVSGVAIQLQLTNNSGASISGLKVGYDIRRYMVAATANELPGYALFYSLDNGATWSNVSSLNPTLAGAGIQVPTTIGVTTVPVTDITLGAAWAANSDLLLRWVDDNAVATSPDQIIGLDNVSITAVTVIGSPPSVALTAPLASDPFLAPATVSLTASASDPDGGGSITKDEFYNGGAKLGEDLSAPYSYDWSAVAAGSYALSAQASDNDGNRIASSSVPIIVAAPPSSGTLVRGPYLNQSRSSSIVVRWRSSQSVAGRVIYGDSPSNLTHILNETATATNHEIKIIGLAAYTRYYYSIGSAYDTLATGADYTFRTSPAAGTATDTRIWVVGDCGRGTTTQMLGRDAYYNWTGSRIPDMCLMLGDNAYNSGTDAEYQTGFFGIYPTIFRKMPLWSTIGNHEANNGAIAATSNGTVANFGSFPYYDMFTFPMAGECGGVASGSERYFSFDYGNIHIINLDSQTSDRRVAEINGADGAMATWLRADLASTTKTWIITMFHHPVYSKGSHDSDTEQQMVQMRTNFAPILEASGVDLVLFGHSHSYERSVLMDGHYGVSSTLTAAMKKNSGNGRTAILNSVSPGGAYIKPLNGPRDHFGTVYTVNGSAGSADGGSLNHPVMAISLNTVGTFNIDINGNTLVGNYIQSGGSTPDTFTIIKQGDADRDGDHIPDAYEDANGLNRASNSDAGNTDTDGDGSSNMAEYIFGQAANVPDRFNWTTTADPLTGHITVSFPTLLGRTYKVFYSQTLQGWLDGSPVITGDGSTMSWTDDGGSTGTAPAVTAKRFYRVGASTVDP